MFIFDSVKKAEWQVQMLQTPQIYGIFKFLKDTNLKKPLCLYAFVNMTLSMDILYLFWKKKDILNTDVRNYWKLMAATHLEWFSAKGGLSEKNF